MKKIMLKNCAARVTGFNKEITVLIDNERSYLVNTSEYQNNGCFSGVPLYVSGRYLFFLFESSYLLSDIVAGVIDWECRKEWIKCFSQDKINEALAIEKKLSSISTKHNAITTYIIESPTGETHKLEIVKTENCYRVFVDGWVGDNILTEEELLQELENPTF